jgi:putative copper export protein
MIFHCLIASVSSEAQEIGFDRLKKIRILLVLTFISSFSWLLFTSSDMAESWRLPDLWNAISQTSFGHMWCLRLILILILTFFIRFTRGYRMVASLFFIFALLLPMISALTGHAGAQKHALLLYVAIDWSHSIAVGIWGGGLWFLYCWLGKRLTVTRITPDISFRVVKRFSHSAIASTGIIAFSGVAMAYMAGVSWRHPWSTTYGTLILGKVFFFSAALLAAAINQFIHLRKWSPENELEFAKSVRREVRFELIFVLFVFFLAGFLARTPMPTG